MAIGTVTKTLGIGEVANAATFFDLVSFAGDAAHVAGGTTGLEALLQAKSKDGRVIIGWIDQSIGSHFAVYDYANKKFKCLVRTTGVDAGSANLAGVTFKGILVSR